MKKHFNPKNYINVWDYKPKYYANFWDFALTVDDESKYGYLCLTRLSLWFVLEHVRFPMITCNEIIYIP